MPRIASRQCQPATTLWLPNVYVVYTSHHRSSNATIRLSFSCFHVVQMFWSTTYMEWLNHFTEISITKNALENSWTPRNIPCSLKISHLNYLIFDELQQPCAHVMSDMVMCQVGFIEFVITPLAEQMVTWPMAVKNSSTKTPTLKPGKMRSFWVETIPSSYTYHHQIFSSVIFQDFADPFRHIQVWMFSMYPAASTI